MSKPMHHIRSKYVKADGSVVHRDYYYPRKRPPFQSKKAVKAELDNTKEDLKVALASIRRKDKIMIELVEEQATMENQFIVGLLIAAAIIITLTVVL